MKRFFWWLRLRLGTCSFCHQRFALVVPMYEAGQRVGGVCIKCDKRLRELARLRRMMA